MSTSDQNGNVIQELDNFLKLLKVYRNDRYLIAHGKATQKQIAYASNLRELLLKDVGRFKPLIKELTGKEKVTITTNGHDVNTDMWLKGLSPKWGETTSDVLNNCIDVTTQAMGKLEDDIREGYRDNRGMIRNQQSSIVDQTTEKVLGNIFTRFHLVVKELKNRHDLRQTIEIKDEYDVQDMLRSLLKLYFDDVRVEEWIPSYAGGSSRMDFLLKNEHVAIEVKKTRDSLSDKQIGEQLIIDIAKYKNHPDSKTLTCFIYDPENLVSNPRGLENDLNQLSTNDLDIRVYITPK